MFLVKLKTALAVLMAVVPLACVLGIVATPKTAGQTTGHAPSDKKQEVKIKWQYKTTTAPEIEKLAPKGSKDRLTDGLNMLGDQGWELVAVVPSGPSLEEGFGAPGAGPPGGFGKPGAPAMPPGGAGGPGMLAGLPKIKPTTYVFKQPR
jgi:hypothetical protein